MVALNDVSLTVTSASQANSTEGDGIRVDGQDLLAMTTSGLSTAGGRIKFSMTPRHSFSISDKFGTACSTCNRILYSSGTNYIDLAVEGSNRLRLNLRINSVSYYGDWVSPVLNSGTKYDFDLSYVANGDAVLLVNGQERIRISSLPSTVPAPATIYYGSYASASAQYDAVFSAFSTSSISENTSAPYSKFGSKSVKIDNSLSAYPDLYTTSVTAANTNAHILSAYVYNNSTGNQGGVVDSSVAQLSYNNSLVSTTYSDEGGGWWRLTGSVTGVASSQPAGVEVKAGKIIYVDGVQLETKNFSTTYADGSLGAAYAWSATANESSSTRTQTTLTYSINSIDQDNNTMTFWMKFNDSLYELRNRQFFTLGSGIMFGRNFGGRRNEIGFYRNDGVYLTYSLTGVDQDAWNFVTIVDNPGEDPKLFVNDVQLTVGYKNATFPDQYLGSTLSFTNNTSYTGISDLRMYSETLTPTQISELYHQGLSTHSGSSESDDRYQSSATYTSPTLDFGGNGAWGDVPLTITDDQINGDINYETRSSEDGVNWSDWSALATVSGANAGGGGAQGSGAAGTTVYSVLSDPRRYLQWRAAMTASSDGNTPVIGGVGDTDTLVFRYVEDTTAPANPSQTALGYSTSATASADLTSSEWYNYATPKFTWAAGDDQATVGQSASGIARYHVLLTTTAEAVPYESQSDSCYLNLAETEVDANRAFVVGSNPASCSLTDANYYLRIQTQDYSGNVSAPVTIFTYKYDGSAPNSPASVSSTTVGYTSQNNFTFYWPAATDPGVNPSEIAYYEYKTLAADGAYADWVATNARGEALVAEATNITAYKEGQNFFLVRSIDFAGNASASMSNLGVSSFYYNASAPTAPVDVAISPETSEESPAADNVFSVAWDKPATYSGEIAKYYYCVNCTPSASVMTETTAAETVNLALTDLALATQQGKNTFYIVAEDNNINTDTGHGNRNFEAAASVDFYAATIAPGAPTNLSVTDTSDREDELWRLTLTWKVPVGGGDVAHYEVYRLASAYTDDAGTGSNAETDYIKVGETTSTAYTDADLSHNREYSYKVKAVDNAGSISVASNINSGTAEGKYFDPPSAGGTPSASAGSTTATITWSTTRPTYGTVEYGKTTDYGSSAGDGVLAETHTVKVTGLAPGETYHFRVQSLDDYTLIGYENTEAYSSDYTFTTLNSPAIAEVVVTDVSLESAVVSWATASLATSEIEYGLTTEYGQSVIVSTTADESVHSARLTGLTHSNLYHFRVRGTTVDADDIFSEDYTFSTVTFPKVTAVVFNTDKSGQGTTASLAWATNVPSTASVDYQAVEVDVARLPASSPLLVETTNGVEVNRVALQSLSQTELAALPVLPASDILTIYQGEMSSTHTQKIAGLNDGSIYIFTIRGRDQYGNEAVSQPIRYVTGNDTKPPTIQNLVIETPTKGIGLETTAQAIISFDTDELAKSQVLWGPGVGSEYPYSTDQSSEFVTQHVIVLRDLDPTSSYHLKINVLDEAGNMAETEDTVIVTPAAQEAAFDVILKNLEDIFGFLKW